VQTGRIQPTCFGMAQPLWAGGPAQQNRARALGQRWRWRRPGWLRLADSGVGKGVALGRLGNAAHPSRGSGYGGPHWKDELCGDVQLAGEERRRGRRPGVVVDSSRCGKVVHGGTVHEAVTGSSEGAGLALHGGLTAVEKAAQWGRRAEEEERRFHGGGWAPYLATTGGGRRAARRRNWGRGNGSGGAVARQGGGGRCLRAVSAIWAPSGL
jgi:hypothetical protein